MFPFVFAHSFSTLIVGMHDTDQNYGSPKTYKISKMIRVSFSSVHKAFTAMFCFVSLCNIIHLPGRDGRYFADDIFRYIFVNEKLCILVEISLKYVP